MERADHEAEARREVRIRPVEERDLPDLLRMVTALAAHHGHRASLDTLASDVLGEAPWLRTLIAEADGRPVGYASSCPRAEMQGGSRGSYLHHLYVDPDLRGAGVGRRLIEASIDLARSADCGFMVVDTEPRNRAAQAVYAACGFEALPGDGSSFRMKLTPSQEASAQET